LAFGQTIGDFGKVEDQLKQYLDEQTHEVFVFDNPPEITAQSVSVRRLDPAEANAELGTAQVWLHENAAARQRLDKAIQIDGQSAVAREAIGMLSFNEGQDKQALAHFEEALRQDPNRYLAGYYRAMLSTGSSSALESVVDRNRDFAPAYIQLAISHIREGNIERALAPALKAAQLRPALGGYHVLVGNILHALGRDTEAATVARFVADRWEDVHHDEAVELWQKLPEQPQQPLQGRVRSRRAPAAGTTVSTGRVASLACRDKDQTMALVIDNAPLTLRVKDEALKLSVSDTVWYGPDHFNRCLHLQGFRVLVVRRQNQLIELDVMSP
jgi:tetratricopeptide (TPR) repeat protein